jgi:ankyrin repeat protein
MERGADPAARDGAGTTAYDAAIKMGAPDTAALLAPAN